MSAYNATVTRQTEEHVWFVFAQEPLSGESFAPRGGASFNVDDSIVVRNVDTGLWFVASGGSMAAPPEEEIPAPPQLSARLAAGRAVFSWTAPTESVTYSLHLQQLRPSVLAPRTFTGLASGSSVYNIAQPADEGFFSVWLSDRGVAGPRTFFTIRPPAPPEVSVELSGGMVTYTWTPPGEFVDYTLEVFDVNLQHYVFLIEEIDSEAGTFTTEAPPAGSYRVALSRISTVGLVVGRDTSFMVLPPPKPPSLSVSVGRVTTIFKWLAPTEATTYTLHVQSLETLSVSIFEGLDSADGSYTARIAVPGSYRAWLVDRGEEGDRTEFTVEPAPPPPALRVSVDGLVATFVWDPPAELTDYTLQLQSTLTADAEIVGSASFGSGLGMFVVTLAGAGSWRAWLRDRTSDGERVTFDTSVPPEEEDDRTPPALRVQSVSRRAETSLLYVELVWDRPLIATTYVFTAVDPDQPQFASRSNVESGRGRREVRLTPNEVRDFYLSEGDVQGPVLRLNLPQLPLPTPPAVEAEVDGNFVRLSWDVPEILGFFYSLDVQDPDGRYILGRFGGIDVDIADGQRSFFLRDPGVYTAWLRRLPNGTDGASASGPRTTFTILPAAVAPTPPALTADPRGFTVLLSWQAPDDQLSRTYSIEITAADGSEFTEAAVRGSSVGRYLATFTGAGTYMARLVDSGVAGHAVTFTLPAAQPSVTPPPPGLNIHTSGLQAVLRWAVPSSAASYDVQLTAAGGSTFSTAASSVSSRLGFYTATLSGPGRYMARLVDGTQIGRSAAFTLTIPKPPTLRASVGRSQVILNWLAPPWKRTYTLQIREPGETSFRDYVENVDSGLGVYTAALISEGDYAVRFADGTVLGPTATFTIASQIPSIFPPVMTVSTNRSTVRFTWQRPLFDRFYTLQLQEPGETSFRNYVENVDSGAGQYVATFVGSGDYRARLVDGFLPGPPVSFRIGSLLPVVTPPTMTVSVSGLNAVFSWTAPLFDTAYSLEIDPPGGGSSFSSAATGIASGSRFYRYTGNAAGVYRARLALGSLKGGVTSFTLQDRSIASLPAVSVSVRSGFEVRFGWSTSGLDSNSYVLEVQEPGSSSYRTLSVFPGGSRSHVFVAAGVYRVRLRVGTTVGAASSFTLRTPDFTPTPPTVRVSVTQFQASFSWDPPRSQASYRLEITSADGAGFRSLSDSELSSDTRTVSRYFARAGRYQVRLVDDGVQGAVSFFTIDPDFPELTILQDTDGGMHTFRWNRTTSGSSGDTFPSRVLVYNADGSFEQLIQPTYLSGGARARFALPESGPYLARLVYTNTYVVSVSIWPSDLYIPGPVRGFTNEAVPPALTASVSGGLVKLSWQPPLLKTIYRLRIDRVEVKTGIASDDGEIVQQLEPNRTYTARLVAGRTVLGPELSFRTARTPPTPTVVVEGREAAISWDAPSTATTYSVQITGADGRIYATVARNVPSGDESVKVDVLSGRRYRARLAVPGDLYGGNVGFNTPPALSASVLRSQITFRWDLPSRHEVYTIKITSPTDSSFMRTFSNVYSRWGRFITDLRTAGSYQAVLEGADGVGPAASFQITNPSPPPLQVATSSRQATFLWPAPRTSTTYRIVTTSPDNSSVNLRSLELASRLQRHRIQLPASGRYQSRLVSSTGSGPTVDYTILPTLSVQTLLRSVTLRWTAPSVADTFDVQVTFQGTFIYQTLASDVDSSLERYSFNASSAGVYHARLADETGFSNALRFTIRI